MGQTPLKNILSWLPECLLLISGLSILRASETSFFHVKNDFVISMMIYIYLYEILYSGTSIPEYAVITLQGIIFFFWNGGYNFASEEKRTLYSGNKKTKQKKNRY